MAPGIDSGNGPLLSWSEIEAMTPEQFKVYENRLRRLADRQGYKLEKLRRRDERAITYGFYRLVDLSDGSVIGAGGFGYALDVRQVAAKLYAGRLKGSVGDFPRPSKTTMALPVGGCTPGFVENETTAAAGEPRLRKKPPAILVAAASKQSSLSG